MILPAIAAIVSAILWPSVAAYAVWRWAAVADRVLDRMRPDVPAGPDDVEVPEDLLALALTQSEAWAQEDTVKAMRERYAELKDWQKVRFAFGVGRIDG